jgi:uncharacterized membrane protein SpoIIM required for sporulation
MSIMVLEQLFKIKQIQKNYFNIFMLGFIFSELGILASFVAFRGSVGIMSLAFISVISMPFLLSLIDVKNRRFSDDGFIKNVFENNSNIFDSYIFLFLGIFLSYLLYALFMPEMSVRFYFREQLDATFGPAGYALTTSQPFLRLFNNNIFILFIFFILSIVFGAGSILFLVWNSSAWGTALGYHIKVRGYGVSLLGKLSVVIKFLPHLVLEASAYLFAIISGVIISQAFYSKELSGSKKQKLIFQGGFLFILSLIILIIAAIVETALFF